MTTGTPGYSDTNPPSGGRGIIGWLKSIYEALVGGITTTGEVEVTDFQTEALSQLLGTMTLANAAGNTTLTELLGSITAGTGSIGLTSSTISDIQTAVTAANNDTVVPELTTIGNSLNDIYTKLLDQFQAGQDVGLTEADMTELATLIATLFHYPTDYPNMVAHTDAASILTSLAAIDAAITSSAAHTVVSGSVTITGSATVNNFPTDYPSTAAHTDATNVLAALAAIDAAITNGTAKTSILGTIIGLATIDTDLMAISNKMTSLAAITDSTSNPTVPKMGSYLMGYDPTSGLWNRVRALSGVLSVAGSLTVNNQPTDFPSASGNALLTAINSALTNGTNATIIKPDPVVLFDDDFRNTRSMLGWDQLMDVLTWAGPVGRDRNALWVGTENFPDSANSVQPFYEGVIAKRVSRYKGDTAKLALELWWGYGAEYGANIMSRAFDFGFDTCDASGTRRYFKFRHQWHDDTGTSATLLNNWQVSSAGSFVNLATQNYPAPGFNENKRNEFYTRFEIDLSTNTYIGLQVGEVYNTFSVAGPSSTSLTTFTDGLNALVELRNRQGGGNAAVTRSATWFLLYRARMTKIG